MPEEAYETVLLEKAPDNIPFEGFPKYKRSPRLIKKVPADKIEIEMPPDKKKIDRRSIVQIKEYREHENKRREMYGNSIR